MTTLTGLLLKLKNKAIIIINMTEQEKNDIIKNIYYSKTGFQSISK